MHTRHTWTWTAVANVLPRETRKGLLQRVYEGAILPQPLLERLCDLEDEEEDTQV